MKNLTFIASIAGQVAVPFGIYMGTGNQWLAFAGWGAAFGICAMIHFSSLNR
jgi:hypothetical protein